MSTLLLDIQVLHVSYRTYMEVLFKLREVNKMFYSTRDTDNRIRSSIVLVLGNVGLELDEEGIQEELKCREAYNNRYHKIRADMGYSTWQEMWAKGIAPGQQTNLL